MSFTYVGVQIYKSRAVQFAALLVNKPGGYTVCLVHYSNKRPVRIVYLGEP